MQTFCTYGAAYLSGHVDRAEGLGPVGASVPPRKGADMLRYLLLLFAFSGLVACSSAARVSNGDATEPDGLSGLAAFVKADLQAAYDDAVKHSDITGANCWGALLRHVGDGKVGDIPAIKGVASAWQAARDLRRRVQAGNPVLEDINRGCAAMFVEAKFTLLKLGIMGLR